MSERSALAAGGWFTVLPVFAYPSSLSAWIGVAFQAAG